MIFVPATSVTYGDLGVSLGYTGPAFTILFLYLVQLVLVMVYCVGSTAESRADRRLFPSPSYLLADLASFSPPDEEGRFRCIATVLVLPLWHLANSCVEVISTLIADGDRESRGRSEEATL